jgi:hypothetical protein
MNSNTQVAAVGRGIDAEGMSFDMVTADSFEPAMANTNRYDAIAWMNGRRPVAENLVSTRSLSALSDFITSGGRLLLCGANVAEVSDSATTYGLERWGQFTRDHLKVAFGAKTNDIEILKAGTDADLTTVALEIGDRNLRYFKTRPSESLLPLGSARPVFAYNDNGGIAGAATLEGSIVKTMVVGFSLDELADPVQQTVLVQQILKSMGLHGAQKTVLQARHKIPVKKTSVKKSKPKPKKPTKKK